MFRIAAALLFLSFSALADDITGKVRIIDGDTLEVGGKRVRLFGIDAPEAKQTCTVDGKEWRCGEEATFVMDRRGSYPFFCNLHAWDGMMGAVFVE